VYSAGAFCEVINDVSLEKYLDGLVNAEFSAEWAEEAVAAQVVAARTYGLFQSRQAQKKLAHFDVDATVRDQVYDGSYKEDYRASRSVERTRGLVLTVGKGNGAEPIKAFYHSMCGGATEFPEHVWGAKMPGFKRSVTCKFCAEASRFNWTLDMQKGDFPALVKGGKLMDIRVTAHTKEGRVATVVTSWEQAGKLVEVPFSGAKFRELIGPAKLRSTWFQVTAVQQGWHFQGHGNGHGVGLCQWGAKVMGEKGRKMAEILKFYYPDAALKKLW
jgi:stage II sporulation protein D